MYVIPTLRNSSVASRSHAGLNRLSVATSRSQALVILVASPQLLEARCKTLRQAP